MEEVMDIEEVLTAVALGSFIEANPELGDVALELFDLRALAEDLDTFKALYDSDSVEAMLFMQASLVLAKYRR